MFGLDGTLTENWINTELCMYHMYIYMYTYVIYVYITYNTLYI